MQRDVMGLYVTSHFPNLVLQKPDSGIERIADRHVHILMRMIFRSGSADMNILAGHTERYAHIIEIALPVMMVRGIDDDAAADEPIVETSSFAAFSRTRSSIAAEGSILWKLICNGVCMCSDPLGLEKIFNMRRNRLACFAVVQEPSSVYCSLLK